ncbi:hypothetical protein TeGR_g15049 [Tetraparma gracilis]|uniref:Uncharacterized protein n=1 Tax=Tetraparma gracilis TaxID=2962635 RepID=A0ABQ6N259_9STRA|nr:hypothetical protein TeGR_g15049 [Tetraparma gracilis]
MASRWEDARDHLAALLVERPERVWDPVCPPNDEGIDCSVWVLAIDRDAPVWFFQCLADAFTPPQLHELMMVRNEAGIEGGSLYSRAVMTQASPEIVLFLANLYPEMLGRLHHYDSEDHAKVFDSIELMDDFDDDPSGGPGVLRPDPYRNPNSALVRKLHTRWLIWSRQVCVHRCVLHSMSSPPVCICTQTQTALTLMIGLHDREKGLLRLVISFVGPNQQTYNPDWALAELLAQKKATDTLAVANAALTSANAALVATNASQQRTIEALSTAGAGSPSNDGSPKRKKRDPFGWTE